MRNAFDRKPQRHQVRTWCRLGVAVTAVSAATAMSCSSADLEQVGDAEGVGEIAQMLGTSVTVSFQNGVLPSSSYAGNTDASIKQASATTNFGGATTLEADGDDSGGVDKSALLKWTLSGIPAGSIVQSASLTLRNVNELNQTYSSTRCAASGTSPR